MSNRPATHLGCPTCDTQGPLLPHEVYLTAVHRGAHQAAFAMAVIPTQRIVDELTESLRKFSESPSGWPQRLADPKET